MLASTWSAWRFKSPSILLCLCTDEYPLLAGSCQYHGWRSKVRLSDYMRCVVCLDLSGHTTSPCVLSLCKTLFAFFGMLLVVVGYHLVLDGPHVLRCVLSNIRCFMQCVCCFQFMCFLFIYVYMLGFVPKIAAIPASAVPLVLSMPPPMLSCVECSLHALPPLAHALVC